MKTNFSNPIEREIALRNASNIMKEANKLKKKANDLKDTVKELYPQYDNIDKAIARAYVDRVITKEEYQLLTRKFY